MIGPAAGDGPAGTAVTRLRLDLGDGVLEATVPLPTGPTRPVRLLPVFRSLADAVVERTADGARDVGAAISCRPGCAACCRQLVPVAAVEARRIQELVRHLTEPARSQVLSRFAAALARLDGAGLLAPLRAAVRLTTDEVAELGIAYFRLGIECPFLEEESCSIYAERPIACRSYVVTSPREHCAVVASGKVRRLRLPVDVVSAMAGLEDGDDTRRIALVLGLEWAEAHAEPEARSSGQEVLRSLLDRLATAE